MIEGQAGLWATVIALGAFHGLNPAMGWPLAVAQGLSERRGRAVFLTVLPLGAGHFLAMALVLLPFALLAWMAEWSLAIRLASAAAVLGFGIYKLVQRGHPRFLARVRPTQLLWWSFLMASTHGAGLMLLPVALDLCQPAIAATSLAGDGADHGALGQAIAAASSLAGALAISAVHTLAMTLAGVTLAWAIYRYLGLRFLKQAWFNLDLLWGLSLVVAGAAGLILALAGPAH